MNKIRRLAAVLLAIAMIMTFTPLYGAAGGVSYAEDESPAAGQEAEDPEKIQDKETQEILVTDEEKTPAETAGQAGDGGNSVNEEPKAETPEGETGEKEPVKKQMTLRKMDGGNGDDEEDDPWELFGLDGPDAVYDDGENVVYSITDPAALEVEGVTHYEAFVGIPQSWEPIGDDVFTYDTAEKSKVTVHGDKIAGHYPDPEDAPEKIAVQIKGLGANEEIRMMAWTMVDFRYSVEDYDLQGDCDVLPRWDGTFDGRRKVHIKNQENPDGYDEEFFITDVEPVERADLLEDFHKESDEEGNYWWYYRAGNSTGTVTFRITYEDLEENSHTYTADLNICGDVYESNLWSDGNVYEALPGGEIKLNASATHKYMDGDQERETDEGLEFTWSIAEGEEHAQIVVDKNDPSKARLVFNEPEDEEEFVNWGVTVRMAVTDTKDPDDPAGEKSSQEGGYACHSEFYSIYPGDLNPVLDVGQSIENQKFELRHYKYGGGEGYNKDCYKTEEIEWIKWDFDENALTIKDADGNVIKNDEEIENVDTFTLTRTDEWSFNARLEVGYHDEYDDRHTAVNIDYWFFDRHYDIWFEDHDVNVYDDGEWTISLSTNEGMNYDALDVDFTFKGYRYDEAEDEDIEVPVPEDCRRINEDGMSVTFFGPAMKDARIDRIWVEAKLYYGEKDLEKEADCNVMLDDSCTTHGRDHLWLSGVPEYKDCTSKGSMKQMCWHCHERRIVEVGPKGHKGKKIAAKASTASKEGNILYYKCNDCGKCFTDANCTKEISADLVIIPRGTVISKLAAQSKGFTVTIKKPTGTYLKHTTGYEVMYALNSGFTSGKKTVVIAKNSTVTYKVTKLTAKKKYYVRVRTYRTINGKKYYSPWSPAKAVTTK